MLYRFPFNTEKTFGYIIAIFSQTVGVFVTATLDFSFVIFPVVHCMYIIALCCDLKNELRKLNDYIKTENNETKEFPINVNIGIKKKLSKIIQLHCDARQLSET